MTEEKVAEQLRKIQIKLFSYETSLRIMVIELALILGFLIGVFFEN